MGCGPVKANCKTIFGVTSDIPDYLKVFAGYLSKEDGRCSNSNNMAESSIRPIIFGLFLIQKAHGWYALNNRVPCKREETNYKYLASL